MKLKPCPFCGSKNIHKMSKYVFCVDCLSQTGFKADWNTRPIEDDLLDALISIENDDGRIPDAIWKMRNAAIAKARGG